ncbi:MAG TPA: cobalt-precorrin-5B (C(1))-methyltransferase CbiD [Xanthobacteraceae bacterium]|nr:cobalt-precorrin-5B (C(1))-methyltransferase CbiD [Xanthobacteraceae bacterium]
MSPQDRPLRRGWTTGACATAAAKAAYTALLTGEFPDPVEVTLPRGERVSFALAVTRKDADSATAGVVKDAGDDPDVTHGALVLATVRAAPRGAGVTFRAGPGVGIVTRPGLPIPPGEPAINPVPRQMIRDAIAEVAAASHRSLPPGRRRQSLVASPSGCPPPCGEGGAPKGASGDDRPAPPPSPTRGEGEEAAAPNAITPPLVLGKEKWGCDVEVEISVAGGEQLAARTLNPRLGIVGGLSILGTTGIVIPFSCAAWIHSIHRGIDVARAAGVAHIAGSTGRNSEIAVQKLHHLPEIALIDMGDFVGGMLKYLRRHPIARVTIAGGVGKMTKLAQGMLDLHAKRGSVDLAALADFARAAGAPESLMQCIMASNTAAEAFGRAVAENVNLGDEVARAARETAMDVVAGSGIDIEIALFDRDGRLAGHAPFGSHHDGASPRNRRR